MGDRHLWCAEPPHGAAKRIIGIDTMALNIHMFDLIGPGGMDSRARCNGDAVRGVGAGVTGNHRLHGHQSTAAVCSGFDLHFKRMPFGGRQIGFFPAVNNANRSFEVIER